MKVPERCPRCASLVTVWLRPVKIQTCLDCNLSWWWSEDDGAIVDDEEATG